MPSQRPWSARKSSGSSRSSQMPRRAHRRPRRSSSALTGAEYEWGVHAAAFGRAVGLTDEQLRSTVDGSWSDACWAPEEAAVFRLADELHATSAVSDELWSELTARFDDRQVLELLVTAGWYHVIAYVCNGARVEPEDWAARMRATVAGR